MNYYITLPNHRQQMPPVRLTSLSNRQSINRSLFAVAVFTSSKGRVAKRFGKNALRHAFLSKYKGKIVERKWQL